MPAIPGLAALVFVRHPSAARDGDDHGRQYSPTFPLRSPYSFLSSCGYRPDRLPTKVCPWCREGVSISRYAPFLPPWCVSMTGRESPVTGRHRLKQLCMKECGSRPGACRLR